MPSAALRYAPRQQAQMEALSASTEVLAALAVPEWGAAWVLGTLGEWASPWGSQAVG